MSEVPLYRNYFSAEKVRPHQPVTGLILALAWATFSINVFQTFQAVPFSLYRLTRNTTPVGPYSSPVPRDLYGVPRGGWVFLVSEVSL